MSRRDSQVNTATISSNLTIIVAGFTMSRVLSFEKRTPVCGGYGGIETFDVCGICGTKLPPPSIDHRAICKFDPPTTRCPLRKSVPRYVKSHHPTGNQNAFVFLGIKILSSTILHAQISKNTPLLHLPCLRPSQTSRVPSLERARFVSLVVKQSSLLRGNPCLQQLPKTSLGAREPRNQRRFLVDNYGFTRNDYKSDW